MVGGLVEEQHVRPAEQHPGHRDAHLPAARQRADVAVDALVVESQPVEDLARLALERVAAEMLVLLLDFAETGEDPIHVVRPGGIGHRVIERLQFVMESAEPATAGDRLVEDASAGHLLDILPEVTDRQLLRHRDFAVVGRLLSDDHSEERGLAGAVGSHEPDLLAGIELEGRVNKQHLSSVLLVDAREGDHPTIVTASRMANGRWQMVNGRASIRGFSRFPTEKTPGDRVDRRARVPDRPIQAVTNGRSCGATGWARLVADRNQLDAVPWPMPPWPIASTHRPFRTR